MYAEITVTALSAVAMTDVLGLEASTPEAIFTRLSASNGETVVIRCSGAVWDRLRPQLRKLSQRRIPALTPAGVVIPGRTAPAMTYTQEWIPGDRPRIHQVEGSLVVGSDCTLQIRGENLLPGARASLTIFREPVNVGSFAAAGTTPLYSPPQAIIRFTAVAKGPIGNQIAVLIRAPSGAGSVAAQEYADGKVLLSIVPPAAGTASLIETLVNTDPVSSVWISATALVGAAVVAPFSGSGEIVGPNVAPQLPYRFLSGGDGTGVAVADVLVSGTDPANRLRLTAQRGGNQGNLINLTVRVNQAANAVTVTGNSIVVDRTAANVSLTTLAGLLNTAASAQNALVEASVVGSGASTITDVAQLYLAGGAGEQLTAQIGGATARVRVHTDTGVELFATAAALATAGVLANEVVQINLLLDYQRLSSVVMAEAAGP